MSSSSVRVQAEWGQLHERARSPIGLHARQGEAVPRPHDLTLDDRKGLFPLDLYFEETMVHLRCHLNEIYPDLSTDAYVDGSHIRREGAASGAYSATGEGGGSVSSRTSS